MKKLLMELTNDNGCLVAILAFILGLVISVVLNFAIVNLIIWLLHFILANPLIVPVKTKWIIAVILTIVEWMFK
ncbi:hypothetical protein [Anaerostipes hadrus]|uniref:hypothetical protein n=1 Tax=Anaerostipes hadrus TaxID=649756 RepID=UPI001EDF558B|nr:hypothetical protein [Anaerostipes hadrus]MCG4627000.1 hypothetical protein [Anaerostipes hadrus]